MKRRSQDHIKLRAMPWKVHAAFAPVEAVLTRIEHSGYIETARGFPVVEIDGQWSQVDECITGIVEFFELAASRKQIAIDTRALASLAKRLRAGVPLTLEDLTQARACADGLRRFALTHLTVGDTNAALRDVKIKWAMEDAMGVPA